MEASLKWKQAKFPNIFTDIYLETSFQGSQLESNNEIKFEPF